MYTGLTGKVTIDGNKVAYISNWSVEASREIIEAAQLGEKTREKAAGLMSWTASADGAVMFGQVNNQDSGHKALFTAMNAGEPVDCEFYLLSNSSGNSGQEVKFSGKGLIESLSVDLSAEDKGNISISISGCGELTYPK